MTLLKELLMKRNMFNVLFIVSTLICCAPVTSYGDTSNSSALGATCNDKVTNDKLIQDLDKLIATLQSSSQTTLGNKIAASCAAVGLGGMAGLFVGSTYRLTQRKTSQITIWSNRPPLDVIDMSDFTESTAKVGIPVGLVTTVLSFLVLKKIIEPKNSSLLNSFVEKLNNFKAALSRNEVLSDVDQIKLEKIITLLTHIFEKSSTNPIATIIKKIIALLSGGLIVGTSGAVNSFFFYGILSKLNETVESNLDDDLTKQLLSKYLLLAFLAGAGLTSLVANKLLDPELINLEHLEQASMSALSDFLPDELSVA